MEQNHGREMLRALIRRYRQTAGAYRPVIDATEFGEIRSRLISFRGDHLRHATELSATLPELAGPELPPGLEAGAAEAVAEVDLDFDLGRALIDLREREHALLADNATLRERDLPLAVHTLLAQHSDDLCRHLRYLDQQLTDKIWERRQAG